MKFQTYLKDCNCDSAGIIIYSGVPVCRWCRIPWAPTSFMNYEYSHFSHMPPALQQSDTKAITDIKISLNTDTGNLIITVKYNSAVESCAMLSRASHPALYDTLYNLLNFKNELPPKKVQSNEDH